MIWAFMVHRYESGVDGFQISAIWHNFELNDRYAPDPVVMWHTLALRNAEQILWRAL